MFEAKLAVYRAVQEAVEIAMFLKDSDIPPKDDYTNIEKWTEIIGEKRFG